MTKHRKHVPAIFTIVPLLDDDFDDDPPVLDELKKYTLEDSLPELFVGGGTCGLPYSERQEQQKERQRNRARVRKAGIRRATSV